MTPGTWSQWMRNLWKSAQTCAFTSQRTCSCQGSWMDTLGWLWKKSVLPHPALQKQLSNFVARVLILFHRLYVENQRLPPIDIAWALMTLDFTRKTSCVLQVYVRTLLRATPLGVVMNWTRKASTATAAWLSNASTSKMLFQSREPANIFLWILLMMKFQSLLCKVYLCAARWSACCLPEAVEVMGSLHIVPYFFTPNIALSL